MHIPVTQTVTLTKASVRAHTKLHKHNIGTQLPLLRCVYGIVIIYKKQLLVRAMMRLQANLGFSRHTRQSISHIVKAKPRCAQPCATIVSTCLPSQNMNKYKNNGQEGPTRSRTPGVRSVLLDTHSQPLNAQVERTPTATLAPCEAALVYTLSCSHAVIVGHRSSPPCPTLQCERLNTRVGADVIVLLVFKSTKSQEASTTAASICAQRSW